MTGNRIKQNIMFNIHLFAVVKLHIHMYIRICIHAQSFFSSDLTLKNASTRINIYYIFS